jgi:hypothetical protein
MHDALSALEEVPNGQPVQAVAPSTLKKPLAHMEHAACPLAEANFPATHGEQLEAPEDDEYPGKHGEHAVRPVDGP